MKKKKKEKILRLWQKDINEHKEYQTESKIIHW